MYSKCDSEGLALYIKNYSLKACLVTIERALSASQLTMLQTSLAQPCFDKYTLKFVCQTDFNDPFVEAGWSGVIGLDRILPSFLV
jgi:hypothetical protein